MSEPATNASPSAPPAPRKRRGVFTYIGLTLLVLILGFLGYVATLPDEFRVERSAMMQAEADQVFPLINNFHEWGKWSPWENVDPNLKRTYEGPEQGEGASYSWIGNSNVGEGKMTITESKPNELIAIKLEFFKPFAGISPTTFKLEPSGSGTKVTWTMNGKNNFIAKGMCVFMDMDTMVGTQFEEGLAKMNKAASKKE